LQVQELAALSHDSDASLAALARQEFSATQALLQEQEEALLMLMLPAEEDAERGAVLEVCCSIKFSGGFQKVQIVYSTRLFKTALILAQDCAQGYT
jgi:protein subunit release factor A